MRWLRDWRLWLALVTLLGLALRLLAWRWSEFRPLGGDEREYFDLALSIARRDGYYDMQFMRPPLFPLGLAVLASLTDSSVQALRLLNALVSTATIPLVYWWTRVLWPEQRPRLALLAAALCASFYTLALNATELLTETVTLFGLTAALLALIRAGGSGSGWKRAIGVGFLLAVVCLIRSVALPLIPLAALWLWRSAEGERQGRRAIALVLAAFLTLLPWTVRNAIEYGGLILIDTTGQENLWLDNDPQGREVVKAQLYALGEDRVARASLATRNGLAAITQHPLWFLSKTGREFHRFWALEHTDDLLARPAIWVSPLETWLRLGLGDGVWLLLILAGAIGLILAPLPRGVRWLLALWVAVIVATSALFHVEFRYRLPIVPVLLPLAAWSFHTYWFEKKQRLNRPARRLLALGLAASLALLTATWGAYPSTTLRLGRKHLALWRAEHALANAEPLPLQTPQETIHSDVAVFEAQAHASRALQLDPDSILARTILVRSFLLLEQPDRAEQVLREAIELLPAHPYPHLLLGDLLRSQGQFAAAKTELTTYETVSRENLQHWSRLRLTQTPLTTTLDLGNGTDLGFIEGWYAADDDARWFSQHAEGWLAAPEAASSLVIRVAAPRPEGASQPKLTVIANDHIVATLLIPATWTEVTLQLPPLLPTQPLHIEFRSSSTFIPHEFDRTNPDGRRLGVLVDWVRMIN